MKKETPPFCVYKTVLHTDCFMTPKKYFYLESKAQVLPIKKYIPSKVSEINIAVTHRRQWHTVLTLVAISTRRKRLLYRKIHQSIDKSGKQFAVAITQMC